MASASGISASTVSDGDPARPLRHRRSGRLSSIQEDSSSPVPPEPPRRSSSFFSESSFEGARETFRSSTDSLLLPRAGRDDEEELHQDPNLWYSLPLLIAIFPALGGVAFKQGAVVITDLLLLVLTAFFLHYCLVVPWLWYHSAQTVRLTKSSVLDTVVDGDEQDEQDESPDGSTRDETPDGRSRVSESQHQKPPNISGSDSDRDAALNELKRHEIMAFSACFAGPLIGAYILHSIRSTLSHFSGDLVSNLHLTLFVLGAEMRPLRHLMKMVQKRTIYLQRLVREDPHISKKVDTVDIQDFGKRLDELETAFADTRPQNGSGHESMNADAVEALQKTQKVLQSQIDALNRAVRRYEKRATAHSMHTEARLHDLETRLRDALSLAAAAANYSQKPGVVYGTLNSLKSVILLPLEAFWAVVIYPLRLLNAAFISIMVRLGLVQGARRRPHSSKQPTSTRTMRDRPSSKPMKK